jgi:hypothetical protein
MIDHYNCVRLYKFVQLRDARNTNYSIEREPIVGTAPPCQRYRPSVQSALRHGREAALHDGICQEGETRHTNRADK